MTKRRETIWDSENATAMARFMQLLGIPALLFMSAWMFSTLNNISDRVARLEEQMKVAADDRYRGSQAQADFARRDDQIRQLNERTQNMEQRFIVSGQRMNVLEDKINKAAKQP